MTQKTNPDHSNTNPLPGQEAAHDEVVRQVETSQFSSNETKQHISKFKRDSELLLWMRYPNRYKKISESFRTLAGKIIILSKNNEWKTFLFSGSEEGVGVSTITLNLGLIMAGLMPDHRILLVDANIGNPCMSRVFKNLTSYGLMDYLLRKQSFTDIVHHTYLPNLDIIPFSHEEFDVLSPFHLNTFSDFMDEASRDYDFVLMDSSPALSSSHTRVISSKVDGVIIVTEAGSSRIEVIEELVIQLEGEGANLVGSFLNKRRFVIPKWLYRYI